VEIANLAYQGAKCAGTQAYPGKDARMNTCILTSEHYLELQKAASLNRLTDSKAIEDQGLK